MNSLILHFLVVLISSAAHAQDISIHRMQWTAAQCVNLISGKIEWKRQRIINDPATTQVNWIDENGNTIKIFSIDSTQGTWSNLDRSRFLFIQCQRQWCKGMMYFTKSASDTIISIHYPRARRSMS